MKTYKLDKNGHPTPEACRAVAAQIRNALKKYPEMKLDMGECKVSVKGMLQHKCGTVHCHAGAFLLGSDDLNIHGKCITYTEGANKMTKMLGFIARYKLEHWADENPDRWGKADGGDMFYCEKSFNGATNVSQIADWWDDVADRSEKLNSQK